MHPLTALVPLRPHEGTALTRTSNFVLSTLVALSCEVRSSHLTCSALGEAITDRVRADTHTHPLIFPTADFYNIKLDSLGSALQDT